MRKFNINDNIKVKLTPLGAQIYYHQYDGLIKVMGENNNGFIKPSMPEIDKNGFTEFQLWRFIEIYRDYFHMTAPQIIEGNNIYFEEESLEKV